MALEDLSIGQQRDILRYVMIHRGGYFALDALFYVRRLYLLGTNNTNYP